MKKKEERQVARPFQAKLSNQKRILSTTRKVRTQLTFAQSRMKSIHSRTSGSKSAALESADRSPDSERSIERESPRLKSAPPLRQRAAQAQALASASASAQVQVQSCSCSCLLLLSESLVVDCAQSASLCHLFRTCV